MNTREYQKTLFETFQVIFGEDQVKYEYDSAKSDVHFSKHKQVYWPRHDIAVGPFNSYPDWDIGNDNTKLMQKHPFTKRLIRDESWMNKHIQRCWNKFSVCYLAIEIELGRGKNKSNSLKHILGSVINASISGSIGIIVVDSDTSKKVYRVYNYLRMLEDRERLKIVTLNNLIIIDESEFQTLLTDFIKTEQ
jgi:hypothetical protein